MMNSKCEFLHLDSEPAGRTPSWVSDYGQAQGQIDRDYQQFRSTAECAGVSDRACRQVFRARRADQNLLTERRRIYTPERLSRVTEMFERVRAEYLRSIEQSTRIPEERKAELLERLRATTLLTSTNEERRLMNSGNPHGECLNSTRGVPRTGAYNSMSMRLNQNTPDEHPPGYLRVNRLIMGSAAFRDAVACRRSGAPETPGAGVTCAGF